MATRTTTQVDAEIEALRARIRRLRLERKASELATNEERLMRVARATGDSNAAEADAERIRGQ